MPVKHGQAGIKQEMHKFKHGTLHSGSKHGPIVTNPKQAIAIAMHEAGMSRSKKSRKGSPAWTARELMKGYRVCTDANCTDCKK